MIKVRRREGRLYKGYIFARRVSADSVNGHFDSVTYPHWSVWIQGYWKERLMKESLYFTKTKTMFC